MSVDNDYPNPDNYQQTSFPSPVAAPDAEPDEGSLLIVGYNPLWTPVLMAALDQLRQFGTWEGDNDAKILAVNRAESLKFILQEPLTVASGVPTPYWDTASDVDDQEDEAVQTWYGYVDDPELPRDELTFFEDAAIWVFTGFLAVGATPAAAILFNTIAPSFVLAMRGDDFGEVIRVLIDGEEQARIDTTGNEGNVINVPVYGNPDNSTHEVMLIKVS